MRKVDRYGPDRTSRSYLGKLGRLAGLAISACTSAPASRIASRADPAPPG
jgi:hypothetical protein